MRKSQFFTKRNNLHVTALHKYFILKPLFGIFAWRKNRKFFDLRRCRTHEKAIAKSCALFRSRTHNVLETLLSNVHHGYMLFRMPRASSWIVVLEAFFIVFCCDASITVCVFAWAIIMIFEVIPTVAQVNCCPAVVRCNFFRLNAQISLFYVMCRQLIAVALHSVWRN